MSSDTKKKAKKAGNNYLGSNENIAVNKRARFDYEITDIYEAGMQLQGSEVKSCRLGKVSINESYATVEKGNIVLVNLNIAEYTQSPRFAQHQPTRTRKLLLHQKEINKLIGAVQKDGMTLVPMRVYFNKKGLVKCEIGLGKGKKTHDKRQTIKERDWNKQKARLIKDNT
ncbi:MAG: SsrA-binding protein [Micavibrio sp.]|nr:SsrA-binding protein [Micavibrio sp.]